MSNTNRYRRGKRQLVQMPVASATVIEKGDMVLMASGLATTPSLVYVEDTYASNKADLQAAAAAIFVGIAETASAVGDTEDVLVDVSLDSIYEFQQSSAAAISFGDLLEIACASWAGSSWYGIDDEVDPMGTTYTSPIAVCVKAHTTAEGAGTLCKLVPQKMMNTIAGQS